MNCDTCLTVLDQFFEGDLDDRKIAGEVAAHIAACAHCTNALDDLQREQEMYSRYLLEVEATPTVWSGISAGVAKEKFNRAGGFVPSWRDWLSGEFVRLRWSPVLTAAAIVVMLGLTLVLTQYLNRRANGPASGLAKQTNETTRPANVNLASNSKGTPEDQRPPSSDQQQHPQEFAYVKPSGRGYAERSARIEKAAVAATQARVQYPGTKQIVIEAEKEYLNAIAVLSREFENRRTQLSPQRLATLKQALSAIDQTIADTSRAARRQSNDSVAVHYMLAAYTNKIDLLREAVL